MDDDEALVEPEITQDMVDRAVHAFAAAPAKASKHKAMREALAAAALTRDRRAALAYDAGHEDGIAEGYKGGYTDGYELGRRRK